MIYNETNPLTPQSPGTINQAKALRKALRLIKGLTFESVSQLSRDPDGILVPFVRAGLDKVTPEDIHNAITNPVKMLFLVCVRSEDDSATLTSPLEPVLLGKLISLFVGARRRYLAGEHSTEESSTLTKAIDHFTAAIDKVDSTVENRRIPSLKAPKGFVGTRSWPPDFFSKFDIAIMAETTIREDLFGIDYQHKGKEQDAPLYPHDQSLPWEVRRYLCWLSLTETRPSSKTTLFLAPIAFTSHQKRQEWYAPTGHKSRFYATVDEFINYAEIEFAQTGKGAKRLVIGLLTPWFFEVAEVTSDAKKKNQDIPNRWEQGCFRAGMALCLRKLERQGQHWSYQLTLFKPGPPHYSAAAEPDSRKERQTTWIRELLDQIKVRFNVTKGWIGGRSMSHIEAPASRKVSADSVEVSYEFITEVMEDPNSFPITHAENVQRKFKAMRV
ncbi:hypothetical protein F4811DRAFT_573203 [Daldinia bambusicola]|nr:hypothetical protein F4811DRAFT_573203 [Daldinia bambusicola]